jgi:hypothetical protein
MRAVHGRPWVYCAQVPKQTGASLCLGIIVHLSTVLQQQSASLACSPPPYRCPAQQFRPVPDSAGSAEGNRRHLTHAFWQLAAMTVGSYGLRPSQVSRWSVVVLWCCELPLERFVLHASSPRRSAVTDVFLCLCRFRGETVGNQAAQHAAVASKRPLFSPAVMCSAADKPLSSVSASEALERCSAHGSCHLVEPWPALCDVG